jgi:hypothetical protein
VEWERFLPFFLSRKRNFQRVTGFCGLYAFAFGEVESFHTIGNFENNTRHMTADIKVSVPKSYRV